MEIPPRYISSTVVKSVLTWPLVNNAVEEAFKAVSASAVDGAEGSFSQPPRTLTFGENKKGILFNMPAYVGNYKLGGTTPASTLACKLVTSFTDNSTLSPPLPSILGNILLFNVRTGQLDAIVEGTDITAWRTASASVVSTKYLYFKRKGNNPKQSVKLAILGCGVQGRIHAIAFCSTFDVAELSLWNRSIEKAQALAEELNDLKSSFKNTNLKISVYTGEGECLKNANVVVTATYTKEPIIHLDKLMEDVHINAVGAGASHHSELSQEVYDAGNVYIDNWASARTELKDLKANIVGEVGEVINLEKYPNPGLTIFQSMGMAAEDATVAQAVLNSVDKKI